MKKPHKGSENLVPFKKGNKFSPGRKKGARPLTVLLRELVEKEIKVLDKETGKQIKKTFGEIVNVALMKKAQQGDTKAIGLIYDRLEGKAVQRTEITGAGGGMLDLKNISSDMSPKEASELYMQELKNPAISKAANEQKDAEEDEKKKTKK